MFILQNIVDFRIVNKVLWINNIKRMNVNDS